LRLQSEAILKWAKLTSQHITWNQCLRGTYWEYGKEFQEPVPKNQSCWRRWCSLCSESFQTRHNQQDRVTYCALGSFSTSSSCWSMRSIEQFGRTASDVYQKEKHVNSKGQWGRER
jgi:hypothetical protein